MFQVHFKFISLFRTLYKNSTIFSVPDPKIENKPVQVNQNQNHPQNAPAQQPLNSSPQNIPVQNAPSPQVNNAQPSVHHV